MSLNEFRKIPVCADKRKIAPTQVSHDKPVAQAQAHSVSTTKSSILSSSSSSSSKSTSNSSSLLSNSSSVNNSDFLSANILANSNLSKENKQESSSTRSSSSSVVAALSVLSFSSSNSTSSISSSVSYGDPSISVNKNDLVSSSSFRSESCKSNILLSPKCIDNILTNLEPSAFKINTSKSIIDLINNSSDYKPSSVEVSELLASYLNKPFYGKEWLCKKLIDFMINKKLANKHNPVETTLNSSVCLVLTGESGTGKTHLCCELKWPTNSANNQLDSFKIKDHIVCTYFLSLFNLRQNSLKNFYLHLSRSLQDLFLAQNQNQKDKLIFNKSDFPFKKLIKLDADSFISYDQLDFDLNIADPQSYVDTLVDEFRENILLPLNNLDLMSKNANYYILLDGIDDGLLQAERLLTEYSKPKNKPSSTEMILIFLNKTFLHFPSWLNLILTSKRCTEKKYLRKYLPNIKYEKIAMDKCVNLNTMILNSNNQIIINKMMSFINSNSSHNSPGPATGILSSLSSHSLTQQTQVALNKQANRLSTPVDVCNAAHFANLKDIQTYILKRLDSDTLLKTKFNKIDKQLSIELLNLLLIKSNYCVLFVEKIFDLIRNDFVDIIDIKSIPVTLNGLYLYLIEKLLQNEVGIFCNLKIQKSQPCIKDLLYSIFGLSLVEFRPIEKIILFEKLVSRYQNLSFDYYEKLFDYISKILFSKLKNSTEKFTLFHSSLVDWFTDVKFCTQKYLNNLGESHFVLAYYYYNLLTDVSKFPDGFEKYKKSEYLASVWSCFKQNLFSAKNSSLNDSHLSYFYSLCEFDYDYKIVLNSLDRKLLQCEKLLKFETDELSLDTNKMADKYETSTFKLFEVNQFCSETPQIRNVLFDFVTNGDLKSIKALLSNDYRLIDVINTMVDSYNQTALLVAVKLNNYELVNYLVSLISRSSDLDHCDNSGWTALRYSAWIGNEGFVNILLERGALVDACDTEGRTALRASVFSGHENIARLLIKYGADVNKCDQEKRSVLHVAVYMGHLSLIKYLLLNGAHINHQDILGRSILATSIFTSSSKIYQFDIIQILIDYGAKLDLFDNNNQTPLILATQENLLQVVCFLIENGADIDHTDNQGCTAIMYAVKNKLDEMVQLLLVQKNAATHILDKEGRSILSIACSIGAEKILGLLMQRGLDEMHRDNYGLTPLHESAYSGHLNIAEMLLDYGSEIDAIDNEGKSSLFYACQEGHLDLVKLFVSRNANINARSHDGSTPFRVSCTESQISVSKYLLYKRVDIDQKDTDGRSTLYFMISSNKNVIEIIQFLLDNGASANEKDNEGRTCLHAAVINGGPDLINLLLKYNAAKEEIDNDGNTCLLTACCNDKLDIVKLLIENNVNINHRNKQGATSLSIASLNGNYKIVEELLKHGANIYGSSRNPIKLALQGGFDEIAKLLQYWSTLIYQQNNEQQKLLVPRNSKSVDSFRAHSARFSMALEKNNLDLVPNFSTRCAITPNAYSSHLKNMTTFSTSFSASPSTFQQTEYLTQTCENNLKLSDDSKLSKLKYVRDKLLRRSTFISESDQLKDLRKANSTMLPHLSEFDGSEKETNFFLHSPNKSGAKSTSSLRMFLLSLNGQKEDRIKKSSIINPCKQILSENEVSDFSFRLNDKEENTLDSKSSSKFTTKSKSSNVLKNSTFVQMIRKKFKFLKPNESNDRPRDFDMTSSQSQHGIEYRHGSDNRKRPMQRSVTDTIASNYANNLNFNSASTSVFRKESGDEHDDVAHIFNRDSLNDCLNPRSSLKVFQTQINSSSGTINNKSNSFISKPSNLHIKRPTCLQLNYFKKETSI